jgi:hypothetical protein
MEHNADLDHALIAELVKWYLPRTDLRGNKHGLARRAGYSARTAQRIVTGDESVSAANLIATSRALGLPEDALVLVGRHDVQALQEEGTQTNVIRWVEEQVKSRSRNGRAVGE